MLQAESLEHASSCSNAVATPPGFILMDKWFRYAARPRALNELSRVMKLGVKSKCSNDAVSREGSRGSSRTPAVISDL